MFRLHDGFLFQKTRQMFAVRHNTGRITSADLPEPGSVQHMLSGFYFDGLMIANTSVARHTVTRGDSFMPLG